MVPPDWVVHAIDVFAERSHCGPNVGSTSTMSYRECRAFVDDLLETGLAPGTVGEARTSLLLNTDGRRAHRGHRASSASLPSRSMAEDTSASVVDPDGRVVDLSEERWAHITDGHPELASCQQDVLDTVRAPTRRLPGRSVGEQWYYREAVGPSRWLKVVVRYESMDRGWIVTARRRMP
jgi:hypothetical protein